MQASGFYEPLLLGLFKGSCGCSHFLCFWVTFLDLKDVIVFLKRIIWLHRPATWYAFVDRYPLKFPGHISLSLTRLMEVLNIYDTRINRFHFNYICMKMICELFCASPCPVPREVVHVEDLFDWHDITGYDRKDTWIGGLLIAVTSKVLWRTKKIK